MAEDTLKGITEVLSNLRKLHDYSPKEIGRSLMEETQVEVKECQRRSPVLSGTMRDEIHAEGPKMDGKEITAIITTGQKSIDYALQQHEDTELIHAVGEAKFIEGPIMESAPHMAARVAHRLDFSGYKK